MLSDFKEAVHSYNNYEQALERMRNDIEIKVNKAQEERELLLKDLIKNTKEGFHKVFHSLAENQSSDSDVFDWSRLERHSDVKVSGKVIERKEVWNSGFVGIIMNKQVSVAPPYYYRWIIKIIKQVGLIDVGMCLESVIKKANFLIQDSTVDRQGYYTIGSTGSICNYSERKKMNSNLSFEFDTNDQIQVDYNLIEGVMTFHKNGGEAKF
jgi:hypothetical protein